MCPISGIVVHSVRYLWETPSEYLHFCVKRREADRKDDRTEGGEELKRTRDYTQGKLATRGEIFVLGLDTHLQIPCYKGGNNERNSILKRKMRTYIYRGPSLFGNMCEPRILPHWPIAMNIGMPAAFFVSDPRLCATSSKCQKEHYAKTHEYVHHAMMIPIVEYVPLVMQKLAKYLMRWFDATVNSNLQVFG